MSQCGINIPIDDVAKALINEHGGDIVEAVLKKIDLSAYVRNDNGVAKDLSLRNSLTIDEAVKRDLCAALQECIAEKIRDLLGCERDNYVTKFYIDKQTDHLVIELKFGERYYISRAEFEGWVKLVSGGIKTGKLDKDGNNRQVITITNNDGSEVKIDVTELSDIHVVSGEVLDNSIIRLALSDKSHVDISAATLVPKNSPYIVSGVFVERDDNYWLDFKRNDGTTVNVAMTDIVDDISKTVFSAVMDNGYRINTQADDYTLGSEDFDGKTIVRADKNGDQTITIPKPDTEDFIGKAIIIRKTAGVAGTFVTLANGAGVSIYPDDITPVRRVGSSVTLVYVGNGVYDAFGELP